VWGDVTSTDVAQAEFRLAQAEADLIAALGVFRIARASFEQVVGVIPDRLTLPEQKFSFPVTIDESVTMAETYNPDVIAAEARHFAAKNNIDVEAGALLPEINLNAGLSMNRDGIGGINDRSDGGQVGVRASVPLYEGGAIRSRVREAKYTANELYMRTLEAKRAAREETVRAFENLNTARAELISRVAQVRAAEVARNGVRQEVDLGQRTILDALDAELEVRDAQIALIDAKRNEVVASFALASALGLLLPGNVGITDLVFDTNRFGWRTLTSGLTTAADTEPEEGR
jgi:outer membrane protein